MVLSAGAVWKGPPVVLPNLLLREEQSLRDLCSSEDGAQMGMRCLSCSLVPRTFPRLIVHTERWNPPGH
jgi:hypothetical protein